MTEEAVASIFSSEDGNSKFFHKSDNVRKAVWLHVPDDNKFYIDTPIM
jgi:hypothetical protein